MAFDVRMIEFSKKINSTLRPPSDGGTLYHCVLKDGCGLVSPVIQLELGLDNSPAGFNYCYIPAFRRYYKIKEWFFEGGLWSASLDCDVLASFRTQIGAANLYVLRSVTFPNGEIVDEKYPLLSTATHVTAAPNATSDIDFTSNFTYGTYIIGVLSGGGSATGGVVYYALSASEFSAFAQTMFSEDSFNIEKIAEDISADLWKSLYNPYQYISSCVWLPFILSDGTAVTSIKFGWWDMPISAKRLDVNIITKYAFFTIPKHPQSATRGNYLNYAPYSSYRLHFMPYGDITLDGLKIRSATSLNCKLTIDLTNGSSILTVYAATDEGDRTNLIATESALFGVQIPIAQVNSNAIGAISSTLGGAGSVAGKILSGDVAGAIQAGTSAIGNAAQNLLPDLQGGGVQGSAAAFYGTENAVLYATFYDVAAWDVEHYGRPTMEKHVINTCNGFVQVADGDVSLPATTEECERVREFLEGGFYFE